ncbi:MAG: hypothetical protein AAFZ11_15175, partial [Pseudomonadota bacterium]
LSDFVTRANAAGKILGSVCHGALGLCGAKGIDGESLVKGRRVTGVTNGQINTFGIAVTPKRPEEELRKFGATYECQHAFRDPFTTHGIPYRWQTLERTAFELIYGAIMVPSLLKAMGETPEAPFEPALVLFGSVLAVTLATAFSERLSHGLETDARILTAEAVGTAWAHSQPTLTVANVPTVLFLAAGMGWLTMETATTLSQAFCIVILVVLGARVGWVVAHNWWRPFGGGVFTGGIGSALAHLKYAIR